MNSRHGEPEAGGGPGASADEDEPNPFDMDDDQNVHYLDDLDFDIDEDEEHEALQKVVSDTSTEEGKSVGSVDEEWDFMQDEDEFSAFDADEEENVYEMAHVEIDVNEEHQNMETTLQKMLSEARTTSGERRILADKFSLMLQAFVSFQESEVELIDHLRTKMGIMDVLKSFITNEVPVGASQLGDEEEMLDEEGGVAENKMEELGAAAAAGIEGTIALMTHKTFKNTQGISIDEMAATTVRETLLEQKNKLEMQEHLKVLQLLELKQLEFEKALLTMHYSEMVKPADLQKEMKELRKGVTELQVEVLERKEDIVQIQHEYNNQDKLVRDDEAKVEELEMDLISKELHVQHNAKVPARLSHESERVELELEKLRDHYDALCARWMEGMESINLIQNTVTAKQTELQELLREITGMQQSRKQSLAESDALTVQFLALKKREHTLTDKREVTVLRTNAAMKERRRLTTEVHKMQKMVTTSHHEISRLERSIRIVADSYLNVRLAHDKLKVAFAAVQSQEDNNNWQKLAGVFRREIERMKEALSIRTEDAAYHTENVNALQEKLNELYDEQVGAGKELQDLIRITVRKRRERQEKSEHCIKLESQAAKLLADKKMQQLVLDECGRSEREIYRSMDEVRKSYNKVKIERASLINDLFQTKQRLTEQNEKFKICNNEIESVNNQCLDRVREIQRVHYINLNAGLRRDSVKNETFRIIDKCRLAKKERDELGLTNCTLRKEIERQKEEIAEIRRRFDDAVHAANKAAIKVRERTEEVCTFIEKIKAYELIILRGTAELNVRDMERVKLESVLAEVKKHLLIVMTNQPDEGALFAEIEKLREQFYKISDERRATEAGLNNLTNKSRIREIHHELITKRETVPLLESKVKLLEENLAKRDCLNLERELILKQIDEITEQSMEQANFLKTTYADDVQELVNLRKALCHIATQIDGMICERSIAAAQADTAEKTFQALAEQMQEAERRFEAGLAPTVGMEAEFKRILWREEMMRRANDHSVQLKRTGYKVPRKPNVKHGAQIFMERFRPKPKPTTSASAGKLEKMPADAISAMEQNFARRTCQARAERKFKPSKWARAMAPAARAKSACSPSKARPVLTGIPFCN